MIPTGSNPIKKLEMKSYDRLKLIVDFIFFYLKGTRASSTPSKR